MVSFLLTMLFVAVCELGDKTQILCILLAVRYKKTTPIILGVLFSTLLNHALAAALGDWVAQSVGPLYVQWGIGLIFIAMGLLSLVPERKGEEQQIKSVHTSSFLKIFGITFLAYFLAEMGDKTQIATMAMSAKTQMPELIVVASTLGILIADVPAILLANRYAHVISTKWMKYIACALFILFGLFVLIGGNHYGT